MSIATWLAEKQEFSGLCCKHIDMKAVVLPDSIAKSNSNYAGFTRSTLNAWLIDEAEGAKKAFAAIKALAPKSIALDLETTALRPRQGDIRLMQIGLETSRKNLPIQFVFDCSKVDVRAIFPMLEDAKVEKQIHYCQFEQAWIWGKFGVKMENVYDTCIAWQTIDAELKRIGLAFGAQHVEMIRPNHRPHNAKLMTLAHELLWMDLPKEEQTSNWGASQLSQSQLVYAALDVAILPMISDKVKMLSQRLELDHFIKTKTQNAIEKCVS